MFDDVEMHNLKKEIEFSISDYGICGRAIYDGRIEPDLTGVNFLNNFFDSKNYDCKLARIKLISPDNFVILAFNATKKMRGDDDDTFKAYLNIFEGDKWGEKLEDYILYLYSLDAKEIQYYQGDTYKIETLLKYIMKNLDNIFAHHLYAHHCLDENGRSIVGLHDNSRHLLYWDEDEMPSRFRLSYLLKAIEDFNNVFKDASNTPEGDDLYRYFYKNPRPNKDFKVLKFTGEKKDENS